MSFMDFYNFLGTGMQASESWAYYNRVGFTDNAKMRQQQKYQEQNYKINWVGVARNDIRGMMGITINRLSNYMLVATLIVGIAAAAFYTVNVSSTCPSFLVFAFFVCIGVSLVFLMLSVLFAVQGQNTAFTNTMRLLTYQVRPGAPAEYSHDYMRQAHWVEQCGARELFRAPGILPNYLLGGSDASSKSTVVALESKKGHGGLHSGVAAEPLKEGPSAFGPSAEDATPLESLMTATNDTWYLKKFAEFMHLWLPFETHSSYCMGLGMVSLGQGTAYFTLGHLSSQEHLANTVSQDFLLDWAACTIAAAFVFLIVIVTSFNIQSKRPCVRFGTYALLSSGPVMGAIAGTTEDELLRHAIVPICFCTHLIFWVAALVMFREVEAEFETRESFWQEERINRYRGLTTEQKRAAIKDELSGKGVEHWPTEDDRFDIQVAKTTKHVHSVVRRSLAVSILMWISLLVWSVLEFWLPLSESSSGGDSEYIYTSSGVSSALLLRSPPPLQEVDVIWPSPLFRPQSLSCAGGRVFVSDQFRVFELLPDGHTQEVRCPLDSAVVGLTARCKATWVSPGVSECRCRPQALVRDRNGILHTVDCASGSHTSLLLRTSSGDTCTATPHTGDAAMSWATAPCGGVSNATTTGTGGIGRTLGMWHAAALAGYPGQPSAAAPAGYPAAAAASPPGPSTVASSPASGSAAPLSGHAGFVIPRTPRFPPAPLQGAPCRAADGGDAGLRTAGAGGHAADTGPPFFIDGCAAEVGHTDLAYSDARLGTSANAMCPPATMDESDDSRRVGCSAGRSAAHGGGGCGSTSISRTAVGAICNERHPMDKNGAKLHDLRRVRHEQCSRPVVFAGSAWAVDCASADHLGTDARWLMRPASIADPGSAWAAGASGAAGTTTAAATATAPVSAEVSFSYRHHHHFRIATLLHPGALCRRPGSFQPRDHEGKALPGQREGQQSQRCRKALTVRWTDSCSPLPEASWCGTRGCRWVLPMPLGSDNGGVGQLVHCGRTPISRLMPVRAAGCCLCVARVVLQAGRPDRLSRFVPQIRWKSLIDSCFRASLAMTTASISSARAWKTTMAETPRCCCTTAD
mmetsp:Transcript_119478/g.381186  ORF Transcript_119478/g.381186 Transcript_119478/m.381186 type:complete len:1087 (+) Transcript_119478:139-3399(+)